MPTSTTNYGLIKPGTDDPILIGQLNDNADVIDATMKSLSDALDVAKLGIKYKGEVNYYSNLPATGNEIGDAYTVKYSGSSGTTPDGTEYVWGAVSGTNQWINFSKDSYTKAEVDALLSLKANTADIPTPSTAAPAMDGTAAVGTSTEYARADHVHPSDTSKQDALTAAQLAAVNSGINSAKVEQIETNKNNISTDEAALIELVDSGAKNIIELGNATCEKNGVTAVLNSDGSIVLSGQAEDASSNFIITNDLRTGSQTDSYASAIPIKSGNYIISGVSDSRVILQILNYNSTSDVNSFDSNEFTATKKYIDFRLIVRRTADFSTPLTIYPMCCTKAAWNISQTYQPYRPSYQELIVNTAIEDISDKITAASGYTINSLTKLYKQNNRVFGQIVISKDTGSFGGAQELIASFNSGYRPKDIQIQGCFFGSTAYNAEYTGYTYIQLATASTNAGCVTIKGYQTSVGTFVNIHVDFVI